MTKSRPAWWTMKRMRYFMSDQTGDAFELFFDRSLPRLAGRGVGSGESAGHGGDETDCVGQIAVFGAYDGDASFGIRIFELS
jgi:hypothetical protein